MTDCRTIHNIAVGKMKALIAPKGELQAELLLLLLLATSLGTNHDYKLIETCPLAIKGRSKKGVQ